MSEPRVSVSQSSSEHAEEEEERRKLIDSEAVEEHLPKNHPNAMCFIVTFVVFMSALLVTFFVYGWFTKRWLLGILFVISVLPSFLIILIAYRKRDFRGNRQCSSETGFDVDKVPVEILIVGFCGGIFITLIVALIGMGTNALMALLVKRLNLTELILFLLFDTFILTSLVEESGKIFIGHFSIMKPLKLYVRHPYGVVLFTLAGALGFAALENVTYVMNEGGEAAWILAIARALLSVPLHGLTGVLIGIGLARRHFLKESSQWIIRILALPVFIHGLYDFVFVLPLRNGEFDRRQAANHLFTAENTVDVGGWTICMYIFNICLVLGSIIYAWFSVGSLFDDWAEFRRKRSERSDTAAANA